MEIVVVIAVLVVGGLFIREQWIKFTRTMHNAKRSIVEVRDIDDIAGEEDARRAVAGMLGQHTRTRKKRSLFKTIIWIVIILVIGCAIISGL